MISIGYHITQTADPLTPISIKALVKKICQPEPAILELINRLRLLKTIDPHAYRRKKTELPYFVIARFHPSIRRKENFAATDFLILDLDHLSSSDKRPKDVCQILSKDERILLAFVSPGMDGLKLLFKLQDQIKDAAFYAAAYKQFAASFAKEYSLETYIDLRTNDVSRATFMSYDPELYYNENCETLDLAAYLETPMDKSKLKAVQELSSSKTQHQSVSKGPDEKILAAIRARLNPKYTKKQKPNAVQTNELLTMVKHLEEDLKPYDISLVTCLPIQYGRQLRISAGDSWAEINVFHGKKGFSVIKTTKSGSSQELAELGKQVLEEILGI